MDKIIEVYNRIKLGVSTEKFSIDMPHARLQKWAGKETLSCTVYTNTNKNRIPNVESYYPRCHECHAGWLVEHVQEKDVASSNFECFGCRNTIYKGDAHYSGRRNSFWSVRELQDARVCIDCTHRYRKIKENNL